MDKIREEFEKTIKGIDKKATAYLLRKKENGNYCDFEIKVAYVNYLKGRKSRDEEIKKLKIKNHRRLRLNRIFMLQIDCPDCGGEYRKVRKLTDLDTDILYGNKIIEYCKSCHLGKITVHTEAELNEAVEEACAEYANTKLYQEGYRSGSKTIKEKCEDCIEDIICFNDCEQLFKSRALKAIRKN